MQLRVPHEIKIGVNEAYIKPRPQAVALPVAHPPPGSTPGGSPSACRPPVAPGTLSEFDSVPNPVEIVSSWIIHSYEAALSHLMILALYMPMVADTGGNTGSQSATVVVRAPGLGDVKPSFKDVLRVPWKEFKVAVLLAVVLGVLSATKVLFLSHSSYIPPGFSLATIAGVIGLALASQVVTATLVGAILPMAAAALKLDPAVVASPALTTVVDITGLLIYFATARLQLGI